MGLIVWIIIGALAGWITSMIAGTNEEQGWVMNIVLGIVGAIVGGFVWRLITGDGFEIEFSVGSLLIAILGGLIVSYLARFLKRAT
ncbi:MAG: GlsB/YeaQ/YmgE family stress response membrane protein [Thermomicrobiales bacterium]|nr:GlsB/YeaQ/YmgE family stress response membrane protein [Thermomicrobiales bacterium]